MGGPEDLPCCSVFALAGAPKPWLNRFLAAVAEVIATPEAGHQHSQMGSTAAHMLPDWRGRRERAQAQVWACIIRGERFPAPVIRSGIGVRLPRRASLESLKNLKKRPSARFFHANDAFFDRLNFSLPAERSIVPLN